MTDKEASFCLSFILLLMAIFIGILALDSHDVTCIFLSMVVPVLSSLIVFIIGLCKEE